MTARRKRSGRPSTVDRVLPGEAPLAEEDIDAERRDSARALSMRLIAGTEPPHARQGGLEAARTGEHRPAESRCDSRAACQDRAAPIMPFDGTQPTFRQSPPIRFRSTSATRAPSPAAIAAVTRPAVPAPITTR